MAVPRQSRDLLLLRSELVARRGAALANFLAGGHQLPTGPFGERLHADPDAHLMRRAERVAGVCAAAHWAQAAAIPCPFEAASSIAALMTGEASASFPWSARSRSKVYGAMGLPVAAATPSVSAMTEAVPAKSPIQGRVMPSCERW